MRIKRRTFLCRIGHFCFRTTFILFVIGVFAAFADSQMDLTRFPAALKACKLPGIEENLACAQLAVFENRRTMRGHKIDINIVVLPSLTPNPKHAPLIFLDGGPGLPSTKAADFFATVLKHYRSGRDIVLVDQRGTGGSNALNCTPISTSPASSLDEMYPLDYVRNCRLELEKKADLTQYTTEIAMDDLNDVRLWLGYNKIDLMGLSYGTRAAQVFVRRHPSAVGKVVLMGAVATYHKMPFYHASNGQRALDLLLDKCVADASCTKAFPGIKEKVRGLVTRLTKQPHKTTFVHSNSSKKYALEIRADIFAEQLRNWMYSRQSSQHIPFVIDSAWKGDFRPFLKRAIPTGEISSTLSDGLYLSVTCAEDVPFLNVAEAKQLSKETIFGNYRVLQQKRACDNWERGKVSNEFLRPVVSDVPILIISGNLDPVTPPDWGTEIGNRFKNSLHVIIPENAHIADGLTNPECMDTIVIDFLNGKPRTEPDYSCVKGMLPGPFLTAETDGR